MKIWNFSGTTYLLIDTGMGRILAPPCISDGEVIDVVPNENGIGGEAVEGNGEMRIVIATHERRIPSGSYLSFGHNG